jgi:A/G-specific adenine glycosylase
MPRSVSVLCCACPVMRRHGKSVEVQLQGALLSYYRERARDLPWRRTTDPYAIWVSEVMLQQTQVKTVLPRFALFLRRFPDVAALAAAGEKTVCEAWAGLGYYRRARNLHRSAVVIAERLGGRFPSSEAALKRLPGVGDYTAAAIASIAFGARTAAVDGNLVRVLSRTFALPGRADERELLRAVQEKACRLVDCSQPGEVNQALMDVGATLCRPESPSCPACPLGRFCRARATGAPAAYPGKKAKASRKILRIAFAFVERGPALLLEQRPLDGLWAGLWEMPSASGARAKSDLGARLGRPLGAPVARISHELTHRHVVASVYRAVVEKRPGQKWWRAPLSAPLSSLARKAIIAVRGSGAAGAKKKPGK